VSRIRQHPIALFLVLAFALTWGAWLPLLASGRVVGVGFAPWFLVGLFGPAVAAVIATAIVGRRRGLRSLVRRVTRVRVGARGWLVALGMPLGIALVVYAGGLFAATFGSGHVKGDFGGFTGFPPTKPLVLWAMLVLAGFGEEIGWRGYVLSHLQRRHSPLVASIGVATCWAVWHVPAFYFVATYRAMPVAMIPMFFASLACGSVFLTWLYNRGQNSILLVAVWHGTYNLLTGTAGAAGALAAFETTAVILAAVVLVGRELLAKYRERHDDTADHVHQAHAR
jgi:membrane protease YdiL (CAAX protease family)